MPEPHKIIEEIAEGTNSDTSKRLIHIASGLIKVRMNNITILLLHTQTDENYCACHHPEQLMSGLMSGTINGRNITSDCLLFKAIDKEVTTSSYGSSPYYYDA